jgi:hypothetical protein
MVREANPYQLDLAGHPLGVPVEKLRRDAINGPEDPAQRAGQS